MSADVTASLEAQRCGLKWPGRQHATIFVLTAVCLFAVACNTKAPEQNNAGYPKVLDDRLKLTLFIEDPDIVTPIGIAVDKKGMVYVLESHTHTPPKDYQGPDTDRVKIFWDSDGDGRSEKNTVFADGFQEGVNITFSPDGNLYVVTSRAVYAIHDYDGDLRVDERKEILRLEEPAKVYAHAALLGITFSSDGWMYVSRGNTGSAFWKLKGTDGSILSGYGDGGNIIRARPDGSRLEQVATGFWNPVDIKFNTHGQLLAADNDPDSRGPNRLVHVVPGGDYGYKSLYGGSGIHPYLAWNGELPGKLPIAAALGEAPSGLLDATHTSLPPDYSGAMLVTIWEESKVVRVDLEPVGISVKGDATAIIEGGTDFRPVALASGPSGEVYMTDWVLRKYPNHGRGRIWKISSTAVQLQGRSDSLTTDSRKSVTVDSEQELTTGLASQDPFERHAAVMRLCEVQNKQSLVSSISNTNPKIRIGGMLAMQRAGYAIAPSAMRKLLNDPEEMIRMQALIWIGEESLTIYRHSIDDVLLHPNVSSALFDAYLETVKHLERDYIESRRLQKEPYAKSIPRALPARFLATFIEDKSRPPSIRALAMKYVEDPNERAELLRDALSNKQHPVVRGEAIRLMANAPGKEMTDPLLAIALDRQEDPSLRADAVVALSRHPGDLVNKLAALLSDSAEDVRLEAARYIRLKSTLSNATQMASKTLGSTAQVGPVLEQLEMMDHENNNAKKRRPASVEEWAKHVGTGGNAARGRRVFYSPQGMCSSCHAINATGGDLGPDLTKVALSKTRKQLLEATIDPSKEISPEFQGWFIRLANGEEVRGRQIDIGDETIEMYTHTSGFRMFSKKDISDYGMTETSLMPSGLEANLTISEVRDLMAFLETSAKAP